MLDKIARTDLGDTTEYDAIVSQPRAARYAAAMMHQTGLLGQFRHVEAEPESDNNAGNANDASGAIEDDFEQLFGLTATE
jgi:hypothetical protein